MEEAPYSRSVPSLPDGRPALDRAGRVAAFETRPDLPASFEQHTGDAAVLIDLEHEQPLFERNADTVRAAASLTKIVTMYVVLDEIERGAISLDDLVVVDARADWRGMPAGSSLMFLNEGDEVTWHELLLGLSIASGNDAAHAVAYELSGGIDPFADRMNEAVARAGIKDVYFTEPSGISADNEIRAGAFAQFLRHYVRRFPDALAKYHSRESISLPKENRNPAPGAGRFRNRNRLVAEYPGADGLKTGYIGASGYNIAASAERDGRRLISVVLGVDGNTHDEGGRRREREAGELLDYGFEQFDYIDLELNRAPTVRIPGSGILPVRMPPVRMIAAWATAASGMEATGGAGEPRVRLNLVSELRAPVAAGNMVGYVDVFLGDERVAWQPVYAAEEVAPGNGILDRIAHAAAWWRGVPGGSIE